MAIMSIVFDATGFVYVEFAEQKFWLSSHRSTNLMTKCLQTAGNAFAIKFDNGDVEWLMVDLTRKYVHDKFGVNRYWLSTRRAVASQVAATKLHRIDNIPAHCYFGAQINVLLENNGPQRGLYCEIQNSTVFRIFDNETGEEVFPDIHYIDAKNQIPDTYLMVRGVEIDCLGLCRVEFANGESTTCELPPGADSVECVNSPFPLLVNGEFAYGFTQKHCVTCGETLERAFQDHDAINTKYGKYTERIQVEDLPPSVAVVNTSRYFNVERTIVEKRADGTLKAYYDLVFRPTGSRTKRALQSHL